MAKKDYSVIKAVKLNGQELGPGDVVSLEVGQANALLGLFVEEVAQSEKKAAAPAGTKGKGGDGL